MPLRQHRKMVQMRLSSSSGTDSTEEDGTDECLVQADQTAQEDGTDEVSSSAEQTAQREYVQQGVCSNGTNCCALKQSGNATETLKVSVVIIVQCCNNC